MALPHADPKLLEDDDGLPPGSAAVAVQHAAHGGLLAVGHVVAELGHPSQSLDGIPVPQDPGLKEIVESLVQA